MSGPVVKNLVLTPVVTDDRKPFLSPQGFWAFGFGRGSIPAASTLF